MKILLIDAPYSSYSWNQEPAPPLGLLYLASAVKEKLYGIQNIHDISILSLQASQVFHKEDPDVILARTVECLRPDIVGISTTTPGTPNSLAVVQKIRQLYPPAKIIIGGYQSTVDTHNILQNKSIDVAVRGDGEVPFCELIALAETKDWTKIHNIKRIGFRIDNRVIITPSSKRIANIDLLPFPDRSLIPMSLFKNIGNVFRAGGIISSRGCPWPCNFCYSPAFWGGASYRSTKSVLNEVELLVNKYGIDKIRFEDDTFTTSPSRAIAISDGIMKRGLHIEWEARTRTDLANEKMLEKMKTSGLRRLQVGIETIKDDSLNKYQKKTTFNIYGDFFSKIRNAGLGLIITVIVGIPSETPEQMMETINWVRERLTSSDRFIRCMYTPFPGTYMDTKFNPKVLSTNLAQYTMDMPLVTSDLFSLEQLLEVKKYADDVMKKNGPHHAVNSPMPNER